MSPSESQRATRDPWTVRVGSWSARHRWPVLGLWLLGTIGLFVASLVAGGTSTQGAVSQDQRAKFESARAYDVFDASGTSEASQSVYVLLSDASRTVDDPAFASAIQAAVERLTALHSAVDGVDGPTFSQVVDPLAAPPAAGLISPDRTTVRIVATAKGDGDVLVQRLAPVGPAIAQLAADNPTLRVHGLSNALANDQISKVVNDDLDGSLRLTIPLTFAILLIAFGTVIAAAIPLILAITALLAAFGVLAVYSQFVAPVSPYASQLVVLIGLAVAVDYSLFILTRFRAEQRRGRTKLAAIHTASATAGRAVYFSGLAVTVSIAGLFLLDDPLFRSMAIGTISVVVIAVIGSLTFLPAVLAILGRGVDRLRLPYFGRDRSEGSGLWGRVVSGAMRRPIVTFVVAGALLLALAFPVLRFQLGQTDLTSFPDTVDSVKAIKLMNEKWPQGSTLELQVVVTHADRPATQAAVEAFSRDVLAIPGVSQPTTTRLSQDGSTALISYTIAGSQNDRTNWDIVREVRGTTVPAHFRSLGDVEGLVTGDAAYAYDATQFYAVGMPQVFVFVLSLSFLLLLVAFRSIVIPIKAILLNLLSAAAAYGVLVLVFQDGWFKEQLGIKPGVVESFVPVFIFTILFGLSMDYHVFILTRIKELRDRGMSSDAAVARGIAITAGTVTSAAAIMVVVFSVFVTLQLTVIKQLGLGLAVAVFLDATIIRSLLLPATMRLLGDWNWYLPGFLGWLPHVTIEAEDAGDEDVPQDGRQPGEPVPEEPVRSPEPAGA
ncbi:MAG: MMPL family transporter [Chloroflexota bacterium]